MLTSIPRPSAAQLLNQAPTPVTAFLQPPSELHMAVIVRTPAPDSVKQWLTLHYTGCGRTQIARPQHCPSRVNRELTSPILTALGFLCLALSSYRHSFHTPTGVRCHLGTQISHVYNCKLCCLPNEQNWAWSLHVWLKYHLLPYPQTPAWDSELCQTWRRLRESARDNNKWRH